MTRCRATIAVPGLAPARCEMRPGHVTAHRSHLYANVALRWVPAPRRYRG